MRRFSSQILPWIVIATCCSLDRTLHAQPQTWSAESIEYFERNVRPLLIENCVSCHSQSVNKLMGGLNMDSRSALIAGGDSGPVIDLQSPEKSLLLEAIRRESLEMPPDRPLSPQQIVILENWIKLGAPWPDTVKSAAQGEGWLAARAAEHWAWRPLQRPAIPAVGNEWPRSSLDAFIYQRLKDQGIQPSPPAQSDELVRRLYVDLVGLLPLQSQLHNLARDPNIPLLVDQLLASPQFGVRWGRHWLDLMRYSETLGHEFDYPIHHAWRYRDAVINAFNQDLPYDQMLAEHIAGDLIQQPRIHPVTGINESLAATAWWWLGDSVHAPVDAKSDWATRTENQVDVFSKAFLGMTVACARCHDHKFDAIAVSDYYGLVGVARSTRRRFAITDPHQHISHSRQTIREQIQSAQAVVLAGWQAASERSLEQWLENSIRRWRAMSPDELNRALPTGSPLFPLRLLVEQPPADVDSDAHFIKRYSQLRSELHQAQADFSRWQAESVVLADFSQDMPRGWRLDAIQAQDFHHRPLIDWFDGSSALPSLPDRFSSKTWGNSQSLTLRSPNFSLTHRCVCLKIRGKSAKSSICVNGYFMNDVHSLLFKDTRLNIDQPDDWGWVVHQGDLNKYIDDPAFISLECEGGSWFDIAEAWLAHRGPPAQPHPAALGFLQGSPPNLRAFREFVVRRLHQSLSACSALDVKAALESSPTEHSHDAAIARVVLRNDPEIVLGKETSTKIQSLVDKLQALDQSTPAPTRLLACEEGDPTDAAIELRGNAHQPGAVTPRGCFQNLVPWTDVQPDSSGRSELVQSLTDPQHPLVARVIVNRVWYYLMGRGLVNSPDNLGVLGSRPTHPELLDHLAGQFIDQGWSIKWLVREIVLSQTYQLSSTPLPQHEQLDADASQYSHRIVRRLDAEVLRDAILRACDSLDESLSGRSVPVYLTQQMTGRGRPGQSGPLDSDNRRSAFIEVRRNFLNPFLLAFDFPMPSTTTGKRNVSNVPAQALGLLNDPLIAQMCQRWVAYNAAIADPRERIDQMISAAFSRRATKAEIDNCLDFIEQAGEPGWIDLAHTLINAKEFWYLK